MYALKRASASPAEAERLVIERILIGQEGYVGFGNGNVRRHFSDDLIPRN
jgi:hypothetical protein